MTSRDKVCTLKIQKERRGKRKKIKGGEDYRIILIFSSNFGSKIFRKGSVDEQRKKIYGIMAGAS